MEKVARRTTGASRPRGRDGAPRDHVLDGHGPLLLKDLVDLRPELGAVGMRLLLQGVRVAVRVAPQLDRLGAVEPDKVVRRGGVEPGAQGVERRRIGARRAREGTSSGERVLGCRCARRRRGASRAIGRWVVSLPPATETIPLGPTLTTRAGGPAGQARARRKHV